MLFLAKLLFQCYMREKSSKRNKYNLVTLAEPTHRPIRDTVALGIPFPKLFSFRNETAWLRNYEQGKAGTNFILTQSVRGDATDCGKNILFRMFGIIAYLAHLPVRQSQQQNDCLSNPASQRTDNTA